MHGPGIAAIVCLTLPLLAQHGSTTAVNPYTGPEHLQAGAKLYRAQCAGCHGLYGKGTGAGPSLISGRFQRGGSDEALFRTISKGIPGTSMPAFSFGGVQIWQLVTQVRALGSVQGASPAAGNPESGVLVFRSNCAGCHAIKGQGGAIGPDLASVGSQHTYTQLRKSLTDPDDEVASEYWTVVANTKAGQTYRGLRLNEDTYSLQMRDERGQLVSLLKQDIAGIQWIRRSPMPSFAGKLSESQIADVVAYLTTLKEEQ